MPSARNLAGIGQRPMQLSRRVIASGSGVTTTQLLLLILLLLLCLCARTGASCTGEEREALLSLLADLSPRPGDGLNASWRGGSPDCCTWDGVGCGADGNGDGAVTRVWLPRRGLGGTISPAVANLTALTHLNLSGNSIGGAFPAALLSLPNAAVVDVSHNRLSGSLPDLPPVVVGAGGALPLQALDVSSNFLEGQFPSVIWAHTPSLVSLNASNNSFHGSIPSFCATSPGLAVLDLSANQLGGGIPAGFGNCSRLRVLSVGRNNLTGELPDDIFDVKPLEQLLVSFNNLTGRLDPGRVAKLSLVSLGLGLNAFTGEVLESISQLPKLESLVLGHNNLSGTLPPALSNWTGLQYLDIRSNSFVGDFNAIDFSGLGNLTIFDMAYNNFTGTMPQSIYSCASLKALRVAMNQIGGQIAPEIGNLRQLQFLSLTFNSFTNISGMFWNLQGCENLTALLVSYNFYGEALPDAGWVGDHVRGLRLLVMKNCKLTGQIPTWLSKLQDLNILELANNCLTGPIPRWIGSMKKLYYLDLSGNQLSGGIPPSLGELPLLTSEQAMENFSPIHLPLAFSLRPANYSGAAKMLEPGYYQLSGVATTLNLSNNYLTGTIPREIGRMVTLQVLDVGSNNLSGGIPPELCSLTKLQFLILSRNRLTGPIPPALGRLNFLAVFSVSYNDLEGPIPTGGQFDAFPPVFFGENPKLCGKVIAVPCTNKPRAGGNSASSKLVSKKILAAIVLGVCSGLILVIVLAGCIVIAVRRARLKGSVGDVGKFVEASMFDSMTDYVDDSKDTILSMSEDSGDAAKHLTFSDILKATNNFGPESIIGSGGYGLVYLAELEDGTRLAVKKLNGDMCLMEREFRAEVETLSSAAARHENLVPLQGFCVRGRLRLLLFPYMANGSLHDWLHDRPGGAEALRWPDRLRIARGASRGVLHIHEHCTPRIVHRDIKSSNILLDESGEARVADFGLARLILPGRTHVTTELVGTPGYIPPEYGQAWVATRRGDVYSFGVVLLELLTGRRPVELVTAQRQQWDLVGWVMQMRSQGRHAEVLDHRIRSGDGDGDAGVEAQMLYVLDLACLCVDAAPLSRPEIQEVVSWLENVDTMGT